MSTNTNIEYVLRNIEAVANELFTTEQMKRSSDKASEIMKSKVVGKIKRNPSGYDYRQSSMFRRYAEDSPTLTKHTKSKVLMGYGEIDEFNGYRRDNQWRSVFDGKVVRLKAERELPKWIILEYGRKSGGGGATPPKDIPRHLKNDFIVPYTPRKRKDYLVGPSDSKHRQKPVFFMTTKDDSKQFSPTTSTHPGIREGRFFRDGLRDAKPEVYEELSDGIYKSLKSIARRYGGEVER